MKCLTLRFHFDVYIILYYFFRLRGKLAKCERSSYGLAIMVSLIGKTTSAKTYTRGLYILPPFCVEQKSHQAK